MPEPTFVDSPDQLMSVAQMRSMSGLDFIRGILEGRHPAPPICRTMSFTFLEASQGRVVCEGTPRFEHYNPLGGVHGGWFGTLLDSCMACAVQTALAQGYGYTTLEYRVNMTRGIQEGGEKIRAVGEVLHVGRRTGTAEGRLIGADSGKLYGFGTTTCLILEL